MSRVSEEEMFRLIEATRNSGLKVDEEARGLVEEGRSSEYYLGYANGVAAVITICRSVAAKLCEAFHADLHRSAETVECQHVITEVIELITIRTAPPLAVAADKFLKARSQNR